ncbi:MAG: response regulator [Magnetospirillum sp.]|nr:MAG: response regulator [Magnetospirillum sp.]
MRILVIEDEPKTAEFLRKGLAESGFGVDVAGDGEEGLALANDGGHDVIVLDVALPKRDGWSVLLQLRQDGRTTPVLFLTARDEVDDRVRGLDLGGDDYLVKPFHFSELLARLRSLLRRPPVLQSQTLEAADLVVDLVSQKVHRAGAALRLTAKEYQLLVFLLRHAGEVLPRTMIAEQVWDMNFDGDTNVVDVAVRRLRAKVDEPFASKLIKTVHGRGYVVEA